MHTAGVRSYAKLVKGFAPRFLMADSRNFHGWAYWRFLCAFMGLSAEDQETYVLGKIEENFSNYSAWHARTSVLQQLNAERPTLSLAELLAADSKSSAAPTVPSSTGQLPQARCTLAADLQLVLWQES